MANRERTGQRDLAYSTWHRDLSDSLSFMDIDWIEWCKTCSRLLAICELKLDTPANAESKTWVTKKIAEGLGIKGFLVLYSKDSRGLISGFRVQQLTPRPTELLPVTTEQWADAIYKFRWCHGIERSAPKPHTVTSNHVHGWAEVKGVWSCIQDYHAVGFMPETGCGALWPG